jgi:L-aminoadipate-semialdehyde dehydrogenase
MVEAQEKRIIDQRTATSLVRLALYDEEGDEESEDEDETPAAKGIDSTLAAKSHHNQRPTAFHLLLASFVVLLHRYTGDTDLVIATSSPSSPDPLLLRIKLDPADSFWSLIKRVQWVEQEAEEDKVPYLTLLEALGHGEAGAEEGGPPAVPLFRVRFFDETDETEHSFLQQTSLTSDLTVFVTSTSSTPSSGTGNPTSLRTSLLPPTISLTLSYNSLVFSHPRMALILDQLLHLVHHAASHPLDPIGSISLLTHKQRKVLPDPRKDLEWTGYRGAITDIFSANAQKFPERTCIVESLAPETVGAKNGLREFTYKQIDEASNVLAHHLVTSGVQREEVVTVYSTRGVDLVVAVMGVLKAGATFSVIGSSLVPLSVPSTDCFVPLRPRLPSRAPNDLPSSRPTSRPRHPRPSRLTPSARPRLRDQLPLHPRRGARSPAPLVRPPPRFDPLRLDPGCPRRESVAQEHSVGHPVGTRFRWDALVHEWIYGDSQGSEGEAL